MVDFSLDECNDVNHPAHYCYTNQECIEVMEELTADMQGMDAVDTAMALKYLWRWNWKGGAKDIRKCIWYLEHLLDRLEAREAQEGKKEPEKPDLSELRAGW